MNIEVVEKADHLRLLKIWEGSVRATHDFLAEEDLQELKPLILEQYFDAVDLRCVKNSKGEILGFCGVHGENIEMLFISPDARGKGLGTLLATYAIKSQGASKVDVNEQNEQALGFYQHIGFSVTDRSPIDGQGKPYPLLHMALQTLNKAKQRDSFLQRQPITKENLIQMPEPDPLKIIAFATPKYLGKWLEKNHARERELWLKIFKKNTGIPSVTWNDVVIEVLCWGWIDGVKKSIDDQAYLQRITPRTARSNWSKRNTEHVERLIGEDRMKEPGLVHVRAAKADGRWENAYVVSEMEVPADFLAALDTQPRVKSFFETLNKSSRYVIAYGLTSAKKPETRQRRFTKYMEMLVHEEKPKQLNRVYQCAQYSGLGQK